MFGFSRDDANMPVATAPSLEGLRITAYRGVAVGEAIMGVNVARDFFAGIADVIGGRASAYEAKLRDARGTAFRGLVDQAREPGGDAVAGVDRDCAVVGGSMLMVSVSGAAVPTGAA